jgi:ATP-dependent exoDNAse (exonuclease V) beta subunit
MNLSELRQGAIGLGAGNLELTASAGSGKTEVVAQRVLHSIAFAMTLEPDRGEILSATDSPGQM